VAYDHIDAFVDHLLTIAEEGGMLDNVLFRIREVVAALADDLTRVGVDVDQALLQEHQSQLENVLAQILDETIVRLRDPRVRECQFGVGRVDGRDRLGFVVQFDGEVGRVSPSRGVR
jgi:hypothetical protein